MKDLNRGKMLWLEMGLRGLEAVAQDKPVNPRGRDFATGKPPPALGTANATASVHGGRSEVETRCA